MTTKSKIALFQMDCKLGQPEANVAKCIQAMEQAAQAGAFLITFPECALTGYAFDSPEEAARCALSAEGPELARLREESKRLGIYVVVGFAELCAGKLYNSAAILSPAKGVEQIYHKLHLPYIGLDKFVEKGDRPLPPLETPFGRLGILICYDVRFPEMSRYLAVSGADILLQPTNFPAGSECTRDVLPMARAFENGVYFLSCNRVGEERGSRFIGGARILDPKGRCLALAGEEKEELLIAEIDPAAARQKYSLSPDGSWSVDIEKDRRPEIFGDPRRLYC